jgi:hypothetical protein
VHQRNAKNARSFLKGVFDRAVVINGSSRDSAIDTP